MLVRRGFQEHSIPCILLKASAFIPGLMITENKRGIFCQSFQVVKSPACPERVCIDHAEPPAVLSAILLRHTIKIFPVFPSNFIIPPDPFPVDRVSPVHLFRQFFLISLPKLSAAVLTVANCPFSRSGPAVVRKAFRMIPLNDLPKDLRYKLLIISSIHTCHISSLG